MKMVSVDSVIETIYRMWEVCDTESIDDYRDLMVNSVKKLPRQVDIVRCEECKHWNGLAKYCDLNRYCKSYDDYCARGERE